MNYFDYFKISLSEILKEISEKKLNFIENIEESFTVEVPSKKNFGELSTNIAMIFSKQLKMLPSTNVGPDIVRTYAPFISEITEIDDKIIRISQNWNTFKSKAGFVSDRDEPTNKFDNITISYKINDITDLNTFLHLGDNKKMLITNIKSDKDLFPDTPFSNILKLYLSLIHI